jgi:CRP/FNR family transcriptional regulator, cyclic AMP receptor protein
VNPDPAPSADLDAVLAGIPMFKGLSAKQRARLASRMTRRRYQAGDVIVRQGTTSMSFYTVVSGSVRVVRHWETGSGVDIVDEGPGGFFGEMGVIDDLPRAATVVALEPTDCALLAKWDFCQELDHDPGIVLALVSILNTRIRQLEERLSSAPALQA